MLNFWDGVLISSMFWCFVAIVCLIRGLWVGMGEASGWGDGFDAGWAYALEVYIKQQMEKEDGKDA